MTHIYKYARHAGFILWLLFCMPAAGEAQQQDLPDWEWPDKVQSDAAADEPRGSIFARWLSELENNRSGGMVKSLLYIIVGCIATLIVLLIWILINRNKMHAREAAADRLLLKFESLLFDYLTVDDKESVFKQISREAGQEFNREILISQMREWSKSMNMGMGVGANEESKTLLRDLYYRMRLDRDSIRKIYSRKWHVQVKGFREMAYMNVTEDNERLYKALKSKNNIIRAEAQLALVRLNREDPFGFLDHLTHPFTLWEQLTVYELLIVHNLPVPQFSRWTDSPNKTVAIFALRMLCVFKQQHAVLRVIECLNHHDSDIRNMAIYVCGEIQLREALPFLRNMYKGESYANCLSIVLAMGKMPDETMLGFLKMVLDKEDDVQLQIEAAKAISKMGEVGVSALVKLMKSEYKNYQIIIRHILDKRIT